MKSLAETKLERFFATYKSQRFQKNSLIVEADESPEFIFYIKSGRVRMYDISRSGCKLTLNTLNTGSFFSLAWIFGHQNNYYFEAIETCELIKAPIADIKEFLDKHPDVGQDALKRVTGGFDGLFKRLSTHMGETAEFRIIIELLIDAWRFSHEEGDTKKVGISINDLTSNTGLARETVSREISKLIDRNLISKKGRTIYINNIKELEAII